MNKKITWGIIIIFISLLYLFQKYIPEGILMYVFNYQIIIILIGIYLILKKKNSLGLTMSFIGLYLYLQKFFSEYFEIGFPLVTLIGGTVIFVLGLNEKNKKDLKKKEPIFKSTMKPSDSEVNVDIEEAEEVK